MKKNMIKKLRFSLIAFLINIKAFAQTYEKPVITNDTTIYLSVCKQGTPPAFPGGEKRMVYYVKKYMCPIYKANKLKGSVLFSFIVEKDGMLTNVKIDEQGLPSTVTNEIKCAINCMPIWKPAISCIENKTKDFGYFRFIYYGSIDQEKCIYFPSENLKN